ncbi:CPBP family intramembrane metalloprotease [bacterium]|nr:MAG: CPBP family intramembrane metalloprotease [bacterium]
MFNTLIKFKNYVLEFLNETKNPAFLLSWILFLTLLFVVRFGLGFDIYFTGKPWGFIPKLAMYPGILLVVLGLLHQTKAHPIPKEKAFWLHFIFLNFTLGMLHYFNFFKASIFDAPLSTWYFYNKVLFNFHATSWYLIPALLWLLIHRKKQLLDIGFKWKSEFWKPYLLLLLAILPFIFGASFDSAFQNSYPRYKPGLIEAYYNLPLWKTVLPFELSYSLQFIGVEWFFRGFFISVMARYLGIHSLFLMATAYGFVHFGKPLPEAISSVFGGLLLGILSYKTKSITGGIIVHLGIGLAMEAFAFWQTS